MSKGSAKHNFLTAMSLLMPTLHYKLDVLNNLTHKQIDMFKDMKNHAKNKLKHEPTEDDIEHICKMILSHQLGEIKEIKNIAHEIIRELDKTKNDLIEGLKLLEYNNGIGIGDLL